MSRKFTTAAALALLAAVPCAARPTSSPVGPRHLFQSYYHTMDVGFAEHDLTKAFTYYSDDFTLEDADGDQTDLGDLKGDIGVLFDRARLIKSTSRIMGMTYLAHGCSLTVQEHMLFTGVSVKTGQLAKIDAYTDVQDFWTKTPQGWRLQKSKIVHSRGLWDGHKITEDDLPDSSDVPDLSGGSAPNSGGAPAGGSNDGGE